MIFSPWPAAYARSFHQMRFLALLALIFSHALSYVNQTPMVHLETLPGFRLIQFFTIFGLGFIVLAGATFRLALGSTVEGGRIAKWPNTGISAYLMILIALDTLKNHWVYDTFDYLFHWDFLKTLLLAYWLIIALGRLHLLLIPVVSIAVTFFSGPIQLWLRAQILTPAQVTDELTRLNAAHFIAVAGTAILAATMGLQVWRSKFRRVTRLSIVLLLSISALLFLRHILAFKPDLHFYLEVRNWLPEGLSGHTANARLYSGLAWAPTALNAFVVTHLALSARPFYERHASYVNAVVVALTLGVFPIYLNDATHERAQGLIRIWEFPAFSKATLISEAFKILAALTLFLGLSYLNRRTAESRFSPMVTRMSRASFLIYLVCTSLTALMARPLAERFGLWLGTLFCCLLTLTAAWMVAEAAHILTGKRIRLALRRAEAAR